MKGRRATPGRAHLRTVQFLLSATCSENKGGGRDRHEESESSPLPECLRARTRVRSLVFPSTIRSDTSTRRYAIWLKCGYGQTSRSDGATGGTPRSCGVLGVYLGAPKHSKTFDPRLSGLNRRRHQLQFWAASTVRRAARVRKAGGCSITSSPTTTSSNLTRVIDAPGVTHLHYRVIRQAKPQKPRHDVQRSRVLFSQGLGNPQAGWAESPDA